MLSIMLGQSCNFQPSNFIRTPEKIRYPSLDQSRLVYGSSCTCVVLFQVDKTVFVSNHLNHQFNEFNRASNARSPPTLTGQRRVCQFSGIRIWMWSAHAKKITRDLHPSVVVKRISIVVGFFVEMGLFLLNCFWARKHIAIPFLCRL